MVAAVEVLEQQETSQQVHWLFAKALEFEHVFEQVEDPGYFEKTIKFTHETLAFGDVYRLGRHGTDRFLGIEIKVIFPDIDFGLGLFQANQYGQIERFSLGLDVNGRQEKFVLHHRLMLSERKSNLNMIEIKQKDYDMKENEDSSPHFAYQELQNRN